MNPGLFMSPGMITLVQSPSPRGKDESSGCNEIFSNVRNIFPAWLTHPMIWFDLPVEQSELLERTVAVHRPGELVGLKYRKINIMLCTVIVYSLPTLSW